MPTVSSFLVERLENLGLKHVFGVPGDYIFNFFSNLIESKKLELINTVDEESAGFAADGYSRINGIGCVVVTYNVGALKLCNSIAGAYAEKSPVIVIAGSPGLDERDILMHSTVGNYKTQYEMFNDITCAQAILDDPNTAGYEIDKCLEALKYYKQPIYIELPKDVGEKTIYYDVFIISTPKSPETDEKNLEDALKEVVDWLKIAKNPVIFAGVEVSRCKLGGDLVKFAERNNIPIVCSLLSKSSVVETHPLYAGIYAGTNSSKPFVKDLVDNSDCLLVCGEVVTEATFGYRPTKVLEKWQMITCTISEMKVRNHNYPNVKFTDFCKSLFKVNLKRLKYIDIPSKAKNSFTPLDKKLTVDRLFDKIGSILDENKIIVADVGDSLYGSSDITTVHHNTFFAPAYYLSMGFAIPASIGINLAKSDARLIVIVGDGSFQMTCIEISTMIKNKLNPIIVILNNKGYKTERLILDGKFNDLLNWNYEYIVNLLGSGNGYKVDNENDFDSVLNLCLKNNSLSIINCIVDDHSSALKRFTESRLSNIGKFTKGERK